MQPLADRLRPEAIEDMVGQSHIIGKGKIIFGKIYVVCKRVTRIG